MTVNDQELSFSALTCTDPVSNLVELIRLDSKTAAHVAQQFENSWVARYPHPLRCTHGVSS
jgi:hypothetical protein